MPKPFSQDLRNRVIDVVEEGAMSCRAAARRYEVSFSTAIKWLERYRGDGLRGPVGHGGHRPSALMPHREFLEAARAEKSDVTLQELCDRIRSDKGVNADTSMMSRFFRRIGVTLKKKTLVAREQDRADISRHRTRWRTYQRRIDPARLVFIDETLGSSPRAGSGPKPT